MGHGFVAGFVDRYGDPDGIGDLKPAAQRRIDQQKLLAVGEFQRRDIGDAQQIWVNIGPFPQMRRGLVYRRRGVKGCGFSGYGDRRLIGAAT